jgi:hypothetical protein
MFQVSHRATCMSICCFEGCMMMVHGLVLKYKLEAYHKCMVQTLVCGLSHLC